MADVIVTLQVRLEDVDTNPEMIIEQATEIIVNGEAKVMESAVEPIAFGLKQVIITFVRDEKKGSVDAIEEDVGLLEGVMSSEVIAVRRAVG